MLIVLALVSSGTCGRLGRVLRCNQTFWWHLQSRQNIYPYSKVPDCKFNWREITILSWETTFVDGVSVGISVLMCSISPFFFFFFFFCIAVRLRHNVIKTGLRKINISYSRITLADICSKLHLDDPEDAEFIVSKAIRDHVIDASIDHDSGVLRSKVLFFFLKKRKKERKKEISLWCSKDYQLSDISTNAGGHRCLLNNWAHGGLQCTH